MFGEENIPSAESEKPERSETAKLLRIIALLIAGAIVLWLVTAPIWPR